MTTAEAIRATIVTALEEVGAGERLSPKALAAFGAGAADIELADAGLDSLGRMELLVALEMEHDVVVAPSVLFSIRSFAELVAHVEHERARGPADHEPLPHADPPPADRPTPPIVRLARRALRRSGTVARMERVVDALKARMAPAEAALLADWHRRGWVLPEGTPSKFSDALRVHLEHLEGRLRMAGKDRPEPYTSRRLGPSLLHFSSPGEPATKTLLVCFAYFGGRDMMMPEAVFLQHLDARRYDVLVVADPWRTGFRRGAPGLGASVTDVIASIAGLGLVERYARLRTFGCSAGAYPASLAGRRLGAEAAIAVAGRFPSERHAWELAKMYGNSVAAGLRHRRTRVLFAYSVTKRRDAAFARRLGRLTRASVLAIEMPSRTVGHNVLEPILQNGELAMFLERTLLAPLGAEYLPEGYAAHVLRLGEP